MFALLVRNEMRQGRGINYYRLTKSYIDKDGNTKHRSVLCLGELPSFDKDEHNRLAAMLTTMIEDGQSVMCDNPKLYEEAMSQSMRMLDIRKYLTSRGWKRDHINFSLMQIIARAIYPYSELKTVRYLRENTALAEMFGIEEKILLFDITNSYFCLLYTSPSPRD